MVFAPAMQKAGIVMYFPIHAKAFLLSFLTQACSHTYRYTQCMLKVSNKNLQSANPFQTAGIENRKGPHCTERMTDGHSHIV